MPRIKVLSPQEIISFQLTPIFDLQDRKKYLILTPWLKQEIKSLKTSESKIGLVLLMGYFNASGKFFDKELFDKKDFEFVSKQLKVQMTFSDFLDNYDRFAFRRNKDTVLKITNYTDFDKSNQLQQFFDIQYHIL